MEAMPQMYRDDIGRTQQAIAGMDRRIRQVRRDLAVQQAERCAFRAAYSEQELAGYEQRRAALVRQLEELERALVRAEQDWAAAVAQGAGVRLDP